ncbi:MAG: type I-E CRISPR-associated endonuclease Cas1e [Ruminococcus sp.]|jgi:CRISPR-associated protein Cas1|nr:type I-E CRISPR-associated endonuclease Cas1e [Ruminococcus sp.]
MNGFGLEKPEITDLPVIRDRISFLYAERCKINRQDGAVTFTDEKGTAFIPAAAISVLLLGPGTDISHRAVELIGTAGTSVIWVGEHGVRYYAHGLALARSAGLINKQAALVSNVQSRAGVVREMYAMRFPNEYVSNMTIQQLRGKEGTRVRNIYRKSAESTGVTWNGRMYNPEDFDAGDNVNKALSAGHACLYGVCHAVIAALGLSPGLGFVHSGHQLAFVYDIADLYKADITIPLAFEVAAKCGENDDIGGVMRRETRDKISDGHILERCVKDLHHLLDNENAENAPETSVLNLWDGSNRFVEAHKSW